VGVASELRSAGSVVTPAKDGARGRVEGRDERGTRIRAADKQSTPRGEAGGRAWPDEGGPRSLGIAVRDLDKALAFYRDALGLEVKRREIATSESARISPVGGQPWAAQAASPDSAIAKLESAGWRYHLTLRVEDITAASSSGSGNSARRRGAAPWAPRCARLHSSSAAHIMLVS
jgi:predicted enzyme related to lactoylglutathione lyase